METNYYLMTPGPVPLPPEVLKALSEPPLHHRTPEFMKIFSEVLILLKHVFQTRQPVFIHTSSGTGAMESALVNCLTAGDSVLVLISGKFGKRWAEMAKILGINVQVFEVQLGQAIKAETVKKLIVRGGFRGVLCQACETSTGVMNPIAEIASYVKQCQDTLLIVDGVTAVGAYDLAMDRLGIDVLISGSQKGLMCPAGMSFIALSEKAWNISNTVRTSRYYWDLRRERAANENGETLFSSPTNLIRALRAALQIMLDGGLQAHFQSVLKRAYAVRAAGAALGLPMFAQVPSPSLTALTLPGKIDGQKVTAHLQQEYQVTIMGGQDQLKGRILRIGHMGYIRNQDVIHVIDALARTLCYLHRSLFPESLIAVSKSEALRFLDSDAS